MKTFVSKCIKIPLSDNSILIIFPFPTEEVMHVIAVLSETYVASTPISSRTMIYINLPLAMSNCLCML